MPAENAPTANAGSNIPPRPTAPDPLHPAQSASIQTSPAQPAQPGTCAPPALLRDATGGRDVSSNLPVGVHVTGDLGVFEHLTRALRRWRRCYRRRWWRTGTTRQQNDKKSQRQHAFPKIVHRTTRDEWKSNSRDPTDHGRPDHSFFIAEHPASASESAGSGGSGCRFCVRIRENWQIEMCFAGQGLFASKLAPTGILCI